MGGLFSKRKPKAKAPPAINAQDRAKLDLKVQRDKLTQYQKRINAVIERETAVARQLLAAGKKNRAILALKKKRYQEQMLSKSESMLTSIQEMITGLEFAQMEKQVFEGLKQGNEVLQELHREMSIEDVERIMEDTQEAVAYQNEIDAAMGTKLSEVDEEAVTKELDALEAATVAEALPAAPSHPLPKPVEVATPTAEPAAATAAPAAPVSEEAPRRTREREAVAA